MPEKTFLGSRFAVAEKLIFRHVNSRLHVGNLKIQDRYPLSYHEEDDSDCDCSFYIHVHCILNDQAIGTI